MLVEIFNANAYWNTPIDKEQGIYSERVPIKIKNIKKELDSKYEAVLDYISKNINPGNRFHILTIDESGDPKTPGFYKFDFTFESLDDDKAPIKGKIIVSNDNDIIEYKRISCYTVTSDPYVTDEYGNIEVVPLKEVLKPDPRSTGYPVGRPMPRSNVFANTDSKNSFNQGNIGLDISSDEETVAEDDTNIPEAPTTVETTKDGISVFSDGTVEFPKSTVSIDDTILETKKKASKDAFMLTMNEKFKRRNKN